MRDMKTLCGVLAVLGAMATQQAHGQAEPNFCGMKDPDPEKTCVSIRLPWQEQPVYFCTEKENIKYRSQCGSEVMHCPSHWGRETLLIATPWDCCPTASVPDHCVNAQCPPKPFNRTCEEIQTNSNNPWDCCPKYFCDENGGTKKDCHFKQLQPGCTSAPKDKNNCVGFYDSHGCCTHYQCDGDGKPGMCPAEIQALKYSGSHAVRGDTVMMNQTNAMNMTGETPVAMSAAATHIQKRSAPMHEMHLSPPQDVKNMNIAPPEGQKEAGYVGGARYGTVVGPGEKHSYSISVGAGPYPVEPLPPVPVRVTCVGDFNCPGMMKCCSSDISVYSDGMALPRSHHPTHGYCVDPIMI